MSGIADSISGASIQGSNAATTPSIQVVSYHPGSVKSEAVLKSEWANAPIAWSEASIPGDFAVWAASDDAAFLHGRYVWASWDVDELKAMEGLRNDGYLRVGLQGPKPCVGKEMFAEMVEMTKGKEAEEVKA